MRRRLDAIAYQQSMTNRRTVTIYIHSDTARYVCDAL